MSIIDDFIEQSNDPMPSYSSSSFFVDSVGFEPSDPVMVCKFYLLTIMNISKFGEPALLSNLPLICQLVLQLETGFVSMGLAEDDSRVFALDRVQFQFPAQLRTMAVSNEILIMALETNHILRIDLQQAHEVEGEVANMRR